MKLLELTAPARRTEQGSAVIVVFTLIVIVLLYLSFNLRTLFLLQRELRLLERQQTRRLQVSFPQPSPAPGTNQVHAHTE
jgi:hypothetical protein